MGFMQRKAYYAELCTPPFFRGALVQQVLLCLPVVPPRLSPGMTRSNDCARGCVAASRGSDYGTGGGTLSLRMFVLLLLSLCLLLGLRLLLGWRRRWRRPWICRLRLC